MKLLFRKSFDSECRQINGMKNNWFSDFSEMIFIFLENENEMIKKIEKASPKWKASPEYHPNFLKII